MNTNLKKLAVAAAVSAGLAGVTTPSHAIIEGAAGEALLIPLVVYSSGDTTSEYNVPVNTLIEVTIPSAIGFETIPNDFTAQNTAPTNPGATRGPADEDLQDGNLIHWYWFDQYSEHQLNGPIEVTADDLVLINWGDVVSQNGDYDGVPGYMIIANENARYRVQGGDPNNPGILSTPDAEFSMFGDAYLVAETEVGFDVDVKIPVLPMSDGYDGPLGSPVTPRDSVKYDNQLIPVRASPLIAGMRTGRSDGQFDDLTLFDLSLSDRDIPTIHVVWNDVNLGDLDADECSDGLCERRQVEVFDDEEYSCSNLVELPYELNVIWIPGWDELDVAPEWTTGQDSLCLPGFGNLDNDEDPGFVIYNLPETIDTNADIPETAAVAFAITYKEIGDADPNAVPVETALGHERGLFK